MKFGADIYVSLNCGYPLTFQQVKIRQIFEFTVKHTFSVSYTYSKC